jgi:hypothetical protein
MVSRRGALGVVLAFAIGLLVLAAGPAIQVASAAPHAYTAEYKGSYLFTDDITDPYGDYLNIKETYSFDVHAYVTVAADGSLTYTYLLSALGTINEDQQQGEGMTPPPAPTSETCRIKPLRKSSASLGAFNLVPQQHNRLGIGAVVPDTAGTQLTVTGPNQNCDVFDGTSVLFSNNDTDGTAWTPFPHDSQGKIFLDALAPTVNDVPASGFSKNYIASQIATAQKGTSIEVVHRSIHATLTTGGIPNAGGNGKLGGPGKRKLTKAEIDTKIDALKAMQLLWEKSVAPCSIAAATAPLLGAGFAGVAVALVIVPVSGSLCYVYTASLTAEAFAAADPPLPAYNTIAKVGTFRAPAPKLPSCQRFKASVRPLCRRVELASLGLIRAAKGTAAVAVAMATTIGQESAAQRAQKSGAVALQDRRLRQLLGLFARARASERAAGRTLAGILRAAGMRVGLTAAQSPKAIAALLARLQGKGVARAKISSLAPGLLVPRANDWLAALPQG